VLVDAQPKEVAPGEEITVTTKISDWNPEWDYFIEDWDVDEGRFAREEPRSFKNQVAEAIWIAPQTIGEHAITVTVRAVRKGDAEEEVVWRESGSDEVDVVAIETVQFAFEGCPDDKIDALAGDVVCVAAHVPDVRERLEVVEVDVSHGSVTTIEEAQDERNKFLIHVQLDDDMTPGEHEFRIAADFAPTRARPGTETVKTETKKVPAKKTSRKRRTSSAT
jgi:hypothetical protein